jgi:hypothetical protein
MDSSIAEVLRAHVGEFIAINYDHETKKRVAELVFAGSDYLAVLAGPALRLSFPLSWVLNVGEFLLPVRYGRDFVRVDVTVYHHVIYKGGFGIGIGLPLGSDNG